MAKKKKRLVLGKDFDYWGIMDADGVVFPWVLESNRADAKKELHFWRMTNDKYAHHKPVRIKITAVKP